MNPYNLIKEQRVLQKMKTMDESIEQTGIKEKQNILTNLKFSAILRTFSKNVKNLAKISIGK